MTMKLESGFSIENSQTGIESLPPEMLKNIFLNLEGRDLKSTRLVCKNWHDLIDTLIPRSVVLDDRQKGNPEFVKNIVKKKVLVKRAGKVAAKTALCYPRNPLVLEKFILFGRVYCKLLVNEILNFQNLQILIIGGETMLKRLHLQQSIYLPNLKKLILNSAFHGETDYPIDLRSHQIAVAKNTLDFLRNIWCPNIYELVLDGDIEQGKINPLYDWKYTALIEFFSKYGKTLKKLAIGESSVLKTHGLNMQDPNVMTTLQYLHISFYGSSFDAQNNNFWATFTASQKNLKSLNVGCLWFLGAHDFFSKLPTTLVNLTLYWNLSESRSLNCSIFGKFENLERLELTFDGTWGQHFSRFSSLRGCKHLRVFVVEQLLISALDLEHLPEYLPKVEILYLFSCGDPLRKLLCSSAPFGITQAALNGLLWNMEELIYLHVCEEDFLGNEETIQQMKNQISPIATTRKGCRGYYVGIEPAWLIESTFTY